MAIPNFLLNITRHAWLYGSFLFHVLSLVAFLFSYHLEEPKNYIYSVQHPDCDDVKIAISPPARKEVLMAVVTLLISLEMMIFASSWILFRLAKNPTPGKPMLFRVFLFFSPIVLAPVLDRAQSYACFLSVYALAIIFLLKYYAILLPERDEVLSHMIGAINLQLLTATMTSIVTNCIIQAGFQFAGLLLGCIAILPRLSHCFIQARQQILLGIASGFYAIRDLFIQACQQILHEIRSNMNRVSGPSIGDVQMKGVDLDKGEGDGPLQSLVQEMQMEREGDGQLPSPAQEVQGIDVERGVSGLLSPCAQAVQGVGVERRVCSLLPSFAQEEKMGGVGLEREEARATK